MILHGVKCITNLGATDILPKHFITRAALNIVLSYLGLISKFDDMALTRQHYIQSTKKFHRAELRSP